MRSRSPLTLRSGFAAVLTTALIGALLAFASPAAAAPDTMTFRSGSGTFEVPARATSMTVTAIGGRGGDLAGFKGGTAGQVSAKMPVNGGETFEYRIGGPGAADGKAVPGGGGPGAAYLYPHAAIMIYGGNGGGATDLRTAGGGLADRLLVAAGGGGSSHYGNGGDAGKASHGLPSVCGDAQPGTAYAGGPRGPLCHPDDPGTAGTSGTFGVGGTGGHKVNGGWAGGGGGGGWWGGGGGSPNGGGGGGSNYIHPMLTGTYDGLSTAAPHLTVTFELDPAPDRFEHIRFDTPVVTANGTDRAALTVTLLDDEGNRMPGETVEVTGPGTIGPVVDHGDGTYTTTVTATTTARVARYDVSVAGTNITASAELRQVPGPATSLDVTPRDRVGAMVGGRSATLTIDARDAHGNLVDPSQLSVTSPPGDSSPIIGTPTVRDDGERLTVELQASQVAGTSSITVTVDGLTHGAVWTQTPGAPDSIDVTVTPDVVPADGATEFEVEAVLRDRFGNLTNLSMPSFSTSGDREFVGSPEFTDRTSHGNGVYTARSTATRTAGSFDVIVQTIGAEGTATVTQTAGPVANVAVTLDKNEIPADGTTMIEATATITDENDNPIVGADPDFETTSAHATGFVRDNGDGTYTASVMATPRAGDYRVIVTAGGVEGEATFTQVPGPPAYFNIHMSSYSVVADGESTITVDARVYDVNNNWIYDATPAFTTDGDHEIEPIPYDGSGNYKATITSTTETGRVELTVTAGDASSTTSFEQTPGPVADILLNVSPDTVVADGTSTFQLDASVVDAFGNGVPVNLTLRSSGGHFSTDVDTHEDGEWTAVYTATEYAGTYVLTATAGGVSRSIEFTQVPGPVATVDVNVIPSSVVANGTDELQVFASVSDEFGNVIDGVSPNVSSDAGHVARPMSPTGSGGYTALLIATTTPGTFQVTVEADGVTGAAGFTQTPGAPASVVVDVEPGAVPADGTTPVEVIAVVTDAHGNPVPGANLQFDTDGNHEFDEDEVIDNGHGTYLAVTTATTEAGLVEVTVTAAGTIGTAAFTQTAGEAATIILTVTEWTDPPTSPLYLAMTAAGTSPAGTLSYAVTATVFDAFGNPVDGADVVFTTSGPQQVGPVTPEGNGIYTVRVDAPVDAGSFEVHAAVAGDDAEGTIVVTMAELPGDDVEDTGTPPTPAPPAAPAPPSTQTPALRADSQLPRTGTDPTPVAAGAVALILAGLLFRAFGVRSQRHGTSAAR